MNIEEFRSKDYKQYLQQKHLAFGVDVGTLENATQEGLDLSVDSFNRIIAGENNEVYDVTTK